MTKALIEITLFNCKVKYMDFKKSFKKSKAIPVSNIVPINGKWKYSAN